VKSSEQIIIVSPKGKTDMRENSKLVGIKKVETELEGIHLRDLLKNQGVDCELFSFHDTALDGISQNWSEGDWGELRVFQEDEQRARQILDEFEKSTPDSET